MVGADPERAWFRTDDPLSSSAVDAAMGIVAEHVASLTQQAMEGLADVDGLHVYGVRVSFAVYNTPEDVDRMVDAVPQAVDTPERYIAATLRDAPRPVEEIAGRV
jgi:hypothetical protein